MGSPEDLNPGIRKVVALLNEWGWTTVDSGDGQTHDYECDRDVGYVVVSIPEEDHLREEADLIYKVLKERGVVMGPDACHIQANYCPFDGHGLVDIHNIHDRDLSDA